MRLHKRKIDISLISCPTPVLLDKNGTPYSPVRTNYFPHAQVLLATEVKDKMLKTNVNGTVKVVDLKALEEPKKWQQNVQEYGLVQYGETKLTKYLIGDGLDRINELAESDVIGITSNFTAEASSVRLVIQKIRKLNPRTLIIVGGRDASARPLFYKHMGADIVAIGDADESFARYIISLLTNPLSITDNWILQQLPIKRVTPQLDLNLLAHLDQYTESGSGDFLHKVGNQLIAAYLETSRGCDRECDFCTERLTRRKNFDLEDIKETVLHYKRHGIRIILFSDDNLLERLNRPNGEAELIELFTFLREQEMVWEFSVGIEIGRFFEKNKIRMELVKALFWNNGNLQNWQGVFRMLAPLENLELSLRHYTKMRPWERNLEILQTIAECGIPQINVGIMFGWPNLSLEEISIIRKSAKEIEQMLNKTTKLSRTVNTGMNLSLFCTMPLPGTPFYEEMQRAKLISYDIEQHPELWNVFTSVIKGENFNPEMITEIRRELISELASEQPEGKVKFHGKYDV